MKPGAKNEMKKCIFILPYFGKFNNYFDLFLKSCGMNQSYEWMIFTDDKSNYNYPSNVKVIYTTFEDLRKKFEEKLDINISLPKPYKLCDFKPTYGYVFSEYIEEYEYWGHCDCDLIFGNLEHLLTPLLEEGYDKLFAAGHLTIYKNNTGNNIRFMKKYEGRILYKEFLTIPEICWFDEDWRLDNVHSIFLESNSKVFTKSLALNPSGRYSSFVQREYNTSTRKYQDVKYKNAIYVWNEGNLYQILPGSSSEKIDKREFLYMHFQRREMSIDKRILNRNCFRIVPNRFILLEQVPKYNSDLKGIKAVPLTAYLYALKKIKKKIKNKLNKFYSNYQN